MSNELIEYVNTYYKGHQKAIWAILNTYTYNLVDGVPEQQAYDTASTELVRLNVDIDTLMSYWSK